MEAHLIEKALSIALEAHKGQTDKYGQPYVLHPLRLMHRFRDPEMQTIAILHDVVEDSDWTLDQLRNEGFSDRIVGTVDALTRREEESYASLIDRAADNPLARKVKLADLEDNMDIRRMKSIGDADRERLNRYRSAYEKLQNLNSDNQL
jgi:(p)ppGpp synthase/HD superfamily hydrolase